MILELYKIIQNGDRDGVILGWEVFMLYEATKVCVSFSRSKN